MNITYLGDFQTVTRSPLAIFFFMPCLTWTQPESSHSLVNGSKFPPLSILQYQRASLGPGNHLTEA